MIIRLLAAVLVGLSGCTYTVGCGCHTPAVMPTDVPKVTPPVKPSETPSGAVKWFVVIVDPSDPSQAIWRTDRGLRDAIRNRGAEFRSFVSTEEDLDQLGYRATVRAVGVPCVILQDANGKLVKAIRPTTLNDVVAIVEAIR